MSSQGYRRTGAVLLIIALVVWFSMPVFRTTSPTAPPDADLAWYRQMVKRERRIGNRETLMGAASGFLAGVGASALALSIAVNAENESGGFGAREATCKEE